MNPAVPPFPSYPPPGLMQLALGNHLPAQLPHPTPLRMSCGEQQGPISAPSVRHSDSKGNPCLYNSWDHVRSKKGSATLECRVCGTRKNKVERLTESKCQDFITSCPRQHDCPYFHVYQRKRGNDTSQSNEVLGHLEEIKNYRDPKDIFQEKARCSQCGCGLDGSEKWVECGFLLCKSAGLNLLCEECKSKGCRNGCPATLLVDAKQRVESTMVICRNVSCKMQLPWSEQKLHTAKCSMRKFRCKLCLRTVPADHTCDQKSVLPTWGPEVPEHAWGDPPSKQDRDMPELLEPMGDDFNYFGECVPRSPEEPPLLTDPEGLSAIPNVIPEDTRPLYLGVLPTAELLPESPPSDSELLNLPLPFYEDKPLKERNEEPTPGCGRRLLLG